MTFGHTGIAFQIKRAAIVLSLLFSLFFLSPVCAAECAADRVGQLAKPNVIVHDDVKELSFVEKSCNVIYQFVNDHEYLLVPLSDAMAGLSACGPWCAAFGGLAGAIDNAAIYFGFADNRYLTWGIFGLAMGHMINPTSLVSEVGGVAVGILLPTGVLNDYPEFIAPAASAIVGGPMVALYSMVDELAINNGVTNKHYMTCFLAGSKAATSLLGNFVHPAVSDFIGVILGSIAANYEEEASVNFLGPIKTAQNLYETYSKFIPKDQLNSHIEKQALALIGNQFMMQVLSLKLAGYEQGIPYNFERLDVPNSPAWGRFGPVIGKVAIFIIPYSLGWAVSDCIDSYFNRKFQYSLEDKIRSDFFSEKTASHLSNSPNVKVLTDNLRGDIGTITKSGNLLIIDAVSASIGGIHGFGVIVVTSPDMLVYSLLYNQVKSMISMGLATKEHFYESQVKALDSEIGQTMQHAAESIKEISDMGGMGATRNELQQLYDASRNCETSQKQWGFVNRLWGQISRVMNFIVNYYLVGREINQGKIPFENRMKAQVAGEQISQLLSFSGDNAQKIALMEQSNNRIVILEGIIHAQPNYSDQINRVTKESEGVIIQDLELEAGSNFLFSIKNLKLELGKKYVVVGDNGCGKSLLLSKIKGTKLDGVNGKGRIYYPLINGKEPKIIMVSQVDYFPVNSSLQKIVSWPDEIPSDPMLNDKQKEEMRLLLKEIKLSSGAVYKQNENKKGNVDVLDLDSIKDWFNILSGGEKKKVLLVSAIMKHPDILILDETFVGLDLEAIIIVQKMLKKYLPRHALILVVDYEARAHNYENFYDKKLNFANGTILLEDMT